MTLDQTSETKTDKSGAKVTTKRTVQTFYAKGAQQTSTPWGVTLKPVPRKKIIEQTKKTDSQQNDKPPKAEAKANRPKVRA